MTLIVFEDEHWRNLAVITQARPVFELRCGGYTVRERAAAMTGMAALGMARAHLMGYYGPPGGLAAMYSGEPTVLVNGRCLGLDWLPRLLAEPVNTVYLADGDLIGARLTPALTSAVLYYLRDQQAADARDELARFARVVELCGADAPARIVYPWDLIGQSGEQIVRDLPLLSARLPAYVSNDPSVVLRGTSIFVGPGARLDGPLVLDARDGPIFIEGGAHIEPFSFIQGPAYIGADRQRPHPWRDEHWPGLPDRRRGGGQHRTGLLEQAPRRIPGSLVARRMGQHRCDDHQLRLEK